MLDFDHEEFLVSLPIWMVTPKRGGKSWKDSLDNVVKVHAGTSGKEGLYPAVFTDEDQAASLIETLTSRVDFPDKVAQGQTSALFRRNLAAVRVFGSIIKFCGELFAKIGTQEMFDERG